MTNADKIRNMTDEELAYVLGWPTVISPPWCAVHDRCQYMDDDLPPCNECALDWLKSKTPE